MSYVNLSIDFDTNINQIFSFPIIFHSIIHHEINIHIQKESFHDLEQLTSNIYVYIYVCVYACFDLDLKHKAENVHEKEHRQCNRRDREREKNARQDKQEGENQRQC